MHTPPPALPFFARLLAWATLVAGLWNAAFGSFYLFFQDGRGSLFQIPGARFFLFIAVLAGLYFAVTSIAFLQRRHWGRRGLQAGYYGMILGAIAWAVFNFIASPGLFTVFASVIGIAFWGAVFVLLARYLDSRSVRRI